MVHPPLLGREAESLGLLPQTVCRTILTFHGLENNHSKHSDNRIFISISNMIYNTLSLLPKILFSKIQNEPHVIWHSAFSEFVWSYNWHNHPMHVGDWSAGQRWSRSPVNCSWFSAIIMSTQVTINLTSNLEQAENLCLCILHSKFLVFRACFTPDARCYK